MPEEYRRKVESVLEKYALRYPEDCDPDNPPECGLERANPFQEWHDYDVEVARKEGFAKGLDTWREAEREERREAGREEGRIEMCAYSVRNLMSSDGINAEGAMDRLKIPGDLRPKVLSALDDDESSSS